MHERTKSKKAFTDLKKPIWRLVDDYTGMYIYSNEVTTDYHGFITKDGREDIEPAAEHPVTVPKEETTYDREKRDT